MLSLRKSYQWTSFLALSSPKSTFGWKPLLSSEPLFRESRFVAPRLHAAAKSFTRATTTTTTNMCRDILDLFYLDEPISSTQDEAKRLLAQNCHTKHSNAVAVLASQQTNGRGTNGRTWEGQKGNVHLTVAVPMDRIPVTITLLPLQIGVLIAKDLADALPSSHTSPQPTVKWPNDVLIGDRKIAGVLIENYISSFDQTCWFLIGIGINCAYAPTNLPPGTRPAICIQEFHTEKLSDSTSREIGTRLAHAFVNWIMENQDDDDNNKANTDAAVIEEWKLLAKFGQRYTIRETGEQVTTVDIQSDGQLIIRGADGRERLIVSDYFC